MQSSEALTDFTKRLRSYVAKRVDSAAVDDLLGDILLRIAEHRDNFGRAQNPLAWLYQVARNAIIDHYRRRDVEQRALQQIKQIADETDDGDTDHYKELALCLTPLIRQLPDEYREALMLTEIDGMKQATAATQLGLSVSGMKSRVQRGRQQLKQALLRCCAIELNNSGRIVEYTQKNRKNCGDNCK